MTASKDLPGASGYSYKEWKGASIPRTSSRKRCWPIMPSGCHRRDQQHLLPHAEEGGPRDWASATPEDFRFAIKASRRMTHIARLKADEAADAVAYLYRNLAALGASAARAIPAAAIPEERRATANGVSWRAARGSSRRLRVPQRELVRRRGLRRTEGNGRGAVLSEREDDEPPPLIETAPWGYVRLRLGTIRRTISHGGRTRLTATAWQEISRVLHA